MRKDSVISAGIWNSIGTFLIKGITFLSVPIFTRLLSPGEYGLVSTYNAYISLYTIIVGLSLNTAISNARIDYASEFQEYCNSIIIASTIIFIIQLTSFNYYFSIIKNLLGITRLFLNTMLCISYAEFLIRTYYGINIVDYKYKDNIKISLFNSVFSIIISVIFIKLLPNKVFARIIGQSLFLLFLIPFILQKITNKHSMIFQFKYVKYSIKIAIPNIFHQISQIIISQSDRVMILMLIDADSAGKYSMVYTYSLMMQMVWNSINDVWVPWLFRQLAIGNFIIVRRCSYIYIFIFSFLTILVLLIAPDLLCFLAPKSYYGARTIIVPLIFSTYFLFLYSFFVNIEFYYKKNSYIAVATALASGINIIGNFMLLPIYGYKIAAYTTLVSYLFLMLFHAVLVTYVFKIKVYALKIFFFYSAVIFVIACLAILLLDFIILRYILLAIVLVISVLCCLKHQEEVKELLDIIRK